MTPHNNKAEPFFITEEVEAELIASGYVFEPPRHVRAKDLPEILAGLTDDKLAAWPSVLSRGEMSAGEQASIAKSDDAGSSLSWCSMESFMTAATFVSITHCFQKNFCAKKQSSGVSARRRDLS